MKLKIVPNIDHKPVRIVVVSDTHIENEHELPVELLRELALADVVVHLGDFTSGEIFAEFRKAYHFYAISGNHDDIAIREVETKALVLKVGDKRIGLYHGFIWPFGIHKRLKSRFKKYPISFLMVYFPLLRIYPLYKALLVGVLYD